MFRVVPPPPRANIRAYLRVFLESLSNLARRYTGSAVSLPSRSTPGSHSGYLSPRAPRQRLRNPPVIQFPVPLAHARMHQARITTAVLFRCVCRTAPTNPRSRIDLIYYSIIARLSKECTFIRESAYSGECVATKWLTGENARDFERFFCGTMEIRMRRNFGHYLHGLRN